MEHYVATTPLPVSVEAAFAYHARRGALERLIPPWEAATIEASDGSIEAGSRVVLKTRVAGVPLRWVARHTDHDPPRRFVDTQQSGPFAAWEHRHEFEQLSENTSRLRDSIRYQLPAGALGRGLGRAVVASKLETMFAYRHRVTRDDLQLHVDHPAPPMTVAVSGSHGLIGAQLGHLLSLLGHRVRRLVRSHSDDPESLAIWQDERNAARLSEVDAVVHLAGKPIAESRWSSGVKQQIRDSRVLPTRQLCERLARLDRKPRVLICASATGIYGDRGEEVLDEHSQLGNEYLASVAEAWEEACRPAVEAGIRVAHARFGVVLSPRGGALAKMLLPAKLAGGALGSGQQWWSWIALDDVLGALYHVLTREHLRGPLNFVAPEPIRNREFASALGSVVHRPSLVPAPALALRLALGEMADALLLSSARVVPRALLDSGYRFRFTELPAALRYSLGYERLASEANS